jgi:LysM repeat protein
MARRIRFYAVCIAAVANVVHSSSLFAVRNRFYDDENVVIIKEVRDSVDDIRHEVNNHESEIRMFDEKLKTLDSIIDSLRDQLHDSSQAHKEQIKGSSATLDTKIAALESLSKGLVADLRQFKSHANDVSTVLAQYKQKISDLEKTVEQQSQNIDHLQAAMRTLMEAFQTKDSGQGKGSSSAVDTTASGLYRVKAGDSLEKIARNFQTSVSLLKEMNGLNNDRITVGQLLKVPEK